MKYRVSEVAGFIIGPSGIAENNEPLRVRHLFRRWLAREGVKVIVDLQELKQFGVWEVGLRWRDCDASDCRRFTPGHGKISTTPIDDIDRAVLNAQKILDHPSDASRQIFFQKCSAAADHPEPVLD